MSYPLKHISIRVPWQDIGWDGRVCAAPRLNGACLKLKRIAEDRDDDAEESVAGQSIKDLPQAKWRSCIAERVGFMVPFEYAREATPDGAACGWADQLCCRFVIARLAALVPSRRVNLTRFHAVFAPNSHWRAPITRAGRGRERRSLRADQTPSAGEPHRAKRWAQRLKRVFNFDIQTCAHCGRPLKVIASIEDSAVIKTILAHLDKTPSRMPARRVLPPAARAPPALCDQIWRTRCARRKCRSAGKSDACRGLSVYVQRNGLPRTSLK